MKVISKLTLGLISCFTLSSCSNGTAVSAEKFKEEADKVEAHEYSGVTVKYSLDEDLYPFKPIEPIKVSGTVKYTYDKENGWTTNSGDYEPPRVRSYLLTNVSKFNISHYYVLSEKNIIANYYINPFKIVLKEKSEDINKVTGSTYKANSNILLTYDKYGFMTKVKIDLTVNEIGESDGEKVEKSFFTKYDITFSYK